MSKRKLTAVGKELYTNNPIMEQVVNFLCRKELVEDYIKQALRTYVAEGGCVKLINKDFIHLFYDVCLKAIPLDKSSSLSFEIVGYWNGKVEQYKKMKCYIEVVENAPKLFLELNIC